MTISLSNLSPPDMSLLERDDEVTFDLDLNGTSERMTLVWVKFSGREETVMVYDGRRFAFPFATRSSKSQTSADKIRFTVAQSGGWEDDVAELKVCTVDSSGHVGPMPAENGLYLPETAADFASLSQPVPSYGYLLNEEAGVLADSFGDRPMSPVLSPGYAQPMPGFSNLKGVEIKSAGGGYFQDGVGWNPENSSYAVYGLFSYDGEAASATRMVYLAASFDRLQMNAGGFLSIMLDGVASPNTTFAYNDGVVHPFLITLNHTAGTFKLFTDLEEIAGTYAAGPHNSFTRIGNPAAQTADDWRMARLFTWVGVEGMDKNTLAAFGHSIGY